jgi:uncharacterized protein (TIGR02679 family)
MNREEECIQYLSHQDYQRFINAWCDKYKSLGHLGGKIKIENLSIDEQNALSNFLGLDLSSGCLEITYNQLVKKIQLTKFESVDFLEVIKALQNKPLYTHSQIKEMKLEQQEIFKQRILNKFINTKSYNWLKDYLYNNKSVNKYIKENKELYNNQLIYVCNALNQLPIYNTEYMLLPMFSQMITNDPHYFDNEFIKELLLKGIEYIFELNINKRSIEDINDIFYTAGLLKDDLSNNCYICHIKPSIESSWDGFYQYYEPWNMNLYNLMQVKTNFINQDIYIIENPSIFRLLVDYIKKEHMNVGLICSNGQINLCTYLLLDKLMESDCYLYYAGDFDPEGLLIADKLKNKYKDNLTLWCYDIKYFNKSLIHYHDISNKRIQLLNNIKDNNIKSIANLILKYKGFIYQEGMIDIYKESLLSNNMLKD